MNTFCKYPWNSIAISPIGEYRICCFSCVDGKNLIEDNNKKPYRIYEKTPETIFNTSTYLSLRNQLINNQQPSICKNCFDTERVTGTSPRLEWNAKWKNDLESYSEIANTKSIKHIDLRLGNLCNLKCRMCNPQTSSQWVDEWNSITSVLGQSSLSENQKRELKDNRWIWNDNTWQSLSEILESVEEISLTGGEPTLALGQYQLYEMILKKKLEDKITLKIYTNLTNIPEKMLQYWSRFKSVVLTFSIDAYGDLNRYIRYPSDWNTIEKNMNKYLEYKNFFFRINTVVQMYNILHLNKLLEWILDKKVFDDVLLTILKDPVHLDIRVLPEELKKIAEDKLSTFTNNVSFIRNNSCQIKQIIAEMNSLDMSQELNKFFAFSTILDHNRNENLLEHVPELKPYKDVWINYVRNRGKII